MAFYLLCVALVSFGAIVGFFFCAILTTGKRTDESEVMPDVRQ